MNIGIDIDDTIAMTSLQANKYLKEYNSNYNDYHELPIDLYYEFIRLYADKIRINEPIFEGVGEAFEYFNDNNYNIVIITARNNLYTSNNKEITEEFLDRHNLKYNKIFYDKERKGLCAKENDIDIFIDDKEEVLDDMNLLGIECIRFSNKESKYKSFDNWYDLIEYLKCKEG